MMRGLDLRQTLVAQAHALHHAGAKVVGDDVGVAQQLDQDLATLGGFQIECQAALVAVEAPKHRVVGSIGVVG